MLSFITYKHHPEELEIVADEEGLQNLIHYLTSIRTGKDHMHLIVGAEIDEFPIPEERKNVVCSAKSVRLEFSESKKWRKQGRK